jgi:hypothetical protein|tara:strand:+ start:170 stop:376 length:207 start_codon:yes stop_codon:yes gene_type:complete
MKKLILTICILLFVSCASVPKWERSPLNNDREVKILNPHKGVYADKDMFSLIMGVLLGTVILITTNPK